MVFVVVENKISLVWCCVVCGEVDEKCKSSNECEEKREWLCEKGWEVISN